jgi:hypothetical protein
MSPTLAEAIEVAREKAYVILDGTLLRIDRVGMTGGRDRQFYSGKHKCHGLNVQVLADPAGSLIWVSPALPGARHDMGAAREHGIIDAINPAGVRAVADTQGGGPAVRVPQRRRRLDPDTGRYRRLSVGQKEVNTAHARQRGPGERANTEELEGPPQDPHQPQPRDHPHPGHPDHPDPDHHRGLNQVGKGSMTSAGEAGRSRCGPITPTADIRW